jgi:hypothetical protein
MEKGYIVDVGSKSNLTDGDFGAFVAASVLLVMGCFGYAAYLYLTVNMGVII